MYRLRAFIHAKTRRRRPEIDDCIRRHISRARHVWLARRAEQLIVITVISSSVFVAWNDVKLTGSKSFNRNKILEHFDSGLELNTIIKETTV